VSRYKVPQNFNPISRCVSGKLQALSLSSEKEMFIIVRQATDLAPERCCGDGTISCHGRV
jgi:hypothetical protein